MHNTTADKSITLTLTAQCNLNCLYCYEHSKNSAKMSFKTAKFILDREMPMCEGQIYIELFGGEPFLAFETIKKIYDYIDFNWPNKSWIMFATTNGTLVHDEIQDWLKNHKKFICGLSLDGNKLMQDINRSNSYDLIDIDFFIKQYPQQAIKMTVSQKTLPYLSEGIIFAHTKGFKVNCNLAFGIDWSNKNNVIILERELNKLIKYYLNNPNIEPCSMLNTPIEHLGTQKDKEKIKKWCGTGTAMKAFYVDGTAYPCQFFMPISAGKERAKRIGEINFLDNIPVSLLDKKCQSCLIREACPTCYGSNYISTGNIYSKDDNLCELTKIIIKARSYFKAMQWNLGLLKLDNKREQALLRSILLVQENF